MASGKGNLALPACSQYVLHGCNCQEGSQCFPDLKKSRSWEKGTGCWRNSRKCSGLTGSQWINFAWSQEPTADLPPSHLLWQPSLSFVPVRNWRGIFCRGVAAQVEQHACILLDVEYENELTCSEPLGQISWLAHPVKETIMSVT